MTRFAISAKLPRRRHKKVNALSTGGKVLYGFAMAVFILWTIILLYPVLWMLLNSLKTHDQYMDDLFFSQPFNLPDGWHFENYLTAFTSISVKGLTETNFWGMLFNTIWYCVLRVGMGVMVPLCTAYAMAKFKFKGRDFIYAFVVTTMTIPVFGTNGAAFTFYYKLGIYNTPLYVVFTGLGGFGGAFLMMYGYFKSISSNYAEAVYIDGGNDYTVFFRVMVPMALPLMTTFAVMTFIGAWNDSGTMLIYLPDYPTLASGVYEMTQGNDSLLIENTPVYFAVLAIMAAPVVTLFVVFSDKIMSNLSIGGIKG